MDTFQLSPTDRRDYIFYIATAIHEANIGSGNVRHPYFDAAYALNNDALLNTDYVRRRDAEWLCENATFGLLHFDEPAIYDEYRRAVTPMIRPVHEEINAILEGRFVTLDALVADHNPEIGTLYSSFEATPSQIRQIAEVDGITSIRLSCQVYGRRESANLKQVWQDFHSAAVAAIPGLGGELKERFDSDPDSATSRTYCSEDILSDVFASHRATVRRFHARASQNETRRAELGLPLVRPKPAQESFALG